MSAIPRPVHCCQQCLARVKKCITDGEFPEAAVWIARKCLDEIRIGVWFILSPHRFKSLNHIPFNRALTSTEIQIANIKVIADCAGCE